MGSDSVNLQATVPALDHDPAGEVVGDGSVTLRGEPCDRKKTGKWRAAAFVYAMACGNLVILMAIQGNLISYTVNSLHLDYATAANITSNLSGTALLLPIFFGFLADAYFGPFWVIVGSCLLYAVGLTILVLSVTLPSLTPAPCDGAVCPRASSRVIGVFEAAIFITCAATAGVKPTVLSLGQRQFDETDGAEKEAGTLFFSLYFAVYNASLFLASTLFFWIQTDVGYTEGYAVMAGFFFLCALIFFTGTPLLRHQRPTGSPLTTLAQVVVAAIRNRREKLPQDPAQLFETSGGDGTNLSVSRIRQIAHTDRLRFLDKAAIVPSSDKALDLELQHKWSNWKVCTITQVEVLKIIVQMIPIWFCCGLMYLIAAQEFTFFIQQAAGLDRGLGPHFRIPAATMTALSMVGALVFIALYETAMVPVLKAWTGHHRGLSPLRRIGLALFLAFLVMVIAAVVEIRRVQTIRREGVTEVEVKQGLIPMSAFWLAPQLLLSGVCNPLMGTAQLELFYDEAPETMVSLAMALAFGSQAVGRFVSTGIVDQVKASTGNGPGESWLTSEFDRGGLTKFYWLISVVMALNFVAFLVAAHFYSYKKLGDSGARRKSNSEQESGGALEAAAVVGVDRNSVSRSKRRRRF